MIKTCDRYTGVACVNGDCPIANREEYEERCMPVIKSCCECSYYRGCEDCAWAESDMCVKEEKHEQTKKIGHV